MITLDILYKCKLCGYIQIGQTLNPDFLRDLGNDGKNLGNEDFLPIGQETPTDLAACPRCGAVYLRTVLDRNQLNGFPQNYSLD